MTTPPSASGVDLARIARGVARIQVVFLDYDLRQPWRTSPKGEAAGSGWFLRAPWQRPADPVRYVATCKHVIDGVLPGLGIKVTTAATGSRRYDARVVSIMPEIDAAILELLFDEPESPFLAWPLGDDKALQMGDSVTVYGYPLASDNVKVVESRVNGTEEGAMQLDGAINYGHSGGCVVRDDCVVGWVIAGLPEANAVSYGQKRTLLDAYRHLMRPWAGHTQVLRKGTIGERYYESTQDRLVVVGARGESCTKEAPCACESGVVLESVLPFSDLRAEPFRVEPEDILCSVVAPVPFLLRPGEVPEFETREVEFRLDNDGRLSLPWSRDQKMTFADAMEYVVQGPTPVRVRLWKSRERRLVEGTCRLHNDYANGSLFQYPPYERWQYEIFAGLVAMPLTGDVLQEFPKLGHRLGYAKREDAAVVVVRVLDGSALSQARNVRAGDVVVRVNDHPVTTLAEYRQALRRPIVADSKRYLKVDVDQRRGEIVAIDRVLEAEPTLAAQYGYEMSPLYAALAPPPSTPSTPQRIAAAGDDDGRAKILASKQ